MFKTYAAVLTIALANAGTAFGEPPMGRKSSEAVSLAEQARSQLNSLGERAGSGVTAREVADEVKAIVKVLRKSRRLIESAAFANESGAKAAAEKISEMSARWSEGIVALKERVPAEARKDLDKGLKETRRTRETCAEAVKILAGGGRPEDPFADYRGGSQQPGSKTGELSRDAKIDAAGKKP